MLIFWIVWPSCILLVILYSFKAPLPSAYKHVDPAQRWVRQLFGVDLKKIRATGGSAPVDASKPDVYRVKAGWLPGLHIGAHLVWPAPPLAAQKRPKQS